jgi:phospholipid/cholesterol/gamma-HCH transport system substrate-binding protein
MARSRSEFRVGIVSFLAIFMLFAGIIWIKGIRFAEDYNTVRIRFTNIGALRPGDAVAVSGVQSGKVKSVELQSGRVIVSCTVSKQVFLGSDARFSVKNIGLMGERFVAINAGTSSVALDLDKIHDGRFDTGIPEVMGMMGDMVSEVRELVRLIGNTVASEGTLREFQETISNLHELSASANELVTNSKDDYIRSLEAIERASMNLDEFVRTNRQRTDSAIGDFAEASSKLNRLVDDLDTLSASLQEFADKLNSGEGSLGLLASDETLYQDVKRAIREVDVLVEDIRKNPKKYLKMEFKLF